MNLGGLVLTVPVALAAGALSFASPCVLPLVPGYLGYVSGSDSRSTAGRRRTVMGAVLFVLGFTLIFSATSTVFGGIGLLIIQHLDLVTRLAGVVVIAMGAVFIGALGPLQRRLTPTWRPRAGLVGAPVLGMLFALGWTPCLSPTLSLITTMALSSGTVGASVLLAVCYSVGLGLPFLLIAFGFGWVTKTFGVLRRHIRAVNLAGGSLLILVGLLMVTGTWGALISQLQLSVGGYESPI